MKYDDASWHSGGDFPAKLSPDAGATHAGMFLAWLLLNGMSGDTLAGKLDDRIRTLAQRKLTPGQFLLSSSDGKFVDDLINEEASAFTLDYYHDDEGQFLEDYEEILGNDVPTLYHVADSWQNFDLLAPVLESRLHEWRLRRT